MSNPLRLHQSVAAVCPIVGVAIGQDGVAASVRIDFDISATAPQRTAAQTAVNAFDWSAPADATYIAQQAKATATAGIDNGQLQAGDKLERIVRALALVVLDEVNILRAASVPTLPARTTAQLVNAIKAKIAATAE